MTENRKNYTALALMLMLLVLFFSQILFTDKIIRAPDIIQEFYWSAIAASKLKLGNIVNFDLKAAWSIEPNSGYTLLGGGVGGHFNILNKLVFILIPIPAAVAWHIVLHLFLGAAGVYCYCRAIGTSSSAAFIAGVIFALAPEMATLINAGHVMKVATIVFAPWAFFCLEKGFQKRKVIWFMATGLVLALQFFNTHWQIAYYTCLAVGLYGIVRMILILREEAWQERAGAYRLIGMNLVTLFFFLSTVAISLMPLASWSTDTNRGEQSGANQGKGGLNREEAMSWSMPPEEMAAFVIPGLFGFSRQEAGENPPNIISYYWGRMHFTQTISYMGLLPWLLVPLPLIFRRDRYTLLAMLGIVGGIVFSMGKYTFIYNLLFDYFPGINRFRVPKMMLFIPVIGLGVMAARGIDVLHDETLRATKTFKRYLLGIVLLPVALLLFFVLLKTGQKQWLTMIMDIISQPTRYESGEQLIWQRWNNIIYETGIAAFLSVLYVFVILAAFRWRRFSVIAPAVLLLVFVADVGRVDYKFMFLASVPQQSKGFKTPVVDFLASQSKQFRAMSLDGDSSYFAEHGIPIFFTSQAVQQVRWQEILDGFSFVSPVADMLNLKYLIMSKELFRKEGAEIGSKFSPVFTSPEGSEVVLENKNVLPKAWLVSTAFVVDSRQQTLQILQNPTFNPGQVALVESPPPIPLATVGQTSTVAPGNVSVNRYEGEHIDLTASVAVNSILVLGEKYYQGWKAQVDGKDVIIHPVNNILRGVYLTPGTHKISFIFDPLPFKIGKYLTLGSFALFTGMLIREWRIRRNMGLSCDAGRS
jgi:hypothetical protein